MVGDGVRTPAEAKIKAVIDFPNPKTKTQIRTFLGLAGYYAHYVETFAVIAAPLTNALKVQTDASDVGMGVVMFQLDSEGKEHPILYQNGRYGLEQMVVFDGRYGLEQMVVFDGRYGLEEVVVFGKW
ncbi:uncharacterized protein LOC129971286 [Argiope bruennichi]|uniref:uncharacterized protein LOC129971286 n=1 Tax=Argiope bruennichi TaxID=94029 RepID=UPI00249516C0|nr:uncharacterized protein LOC129971286 [Argiope bruennichi]